MPLPCPGRRINIYALLNVHFLIQEIYNIFKSLLIAKNVKLEIVRLFVRCNPESVYVMESTVRRKGLYPPFPPL